MRFDEQRYSRKMVAEFTAKRDLAKQLGGDVAHFERLIEKWKARA